MKKRLVCSFAVFSMLYALCAMQVFPAVPGKLNYQGKLTDNQGDLITGTKEIDFALFTDAASSFAVWTESHVGVQVTNGLFNVVLGTANDLSSSFENYDSLYLEIGVEGETLSPRQEMASTGYALKAGSADGPPYEMETYVVKADGTPGVDCDFTTLSDAISSAGSGNCSIFVKNGTYIENISIAGIRNLIIRGEGYGAVLKNNGSSNTVTIGGEFGNIIFRDLRIEIGEAGFAAIAITSEDGDRVQVYNCQIISTSSGDAYGIDVSIRTGNATVVNNHFETTPWIYKGIAIQGGFWNSQIRGNSFINWKKALSLTDTGHGVYSSNLLSFYGTGEKSTAATVGFELNSSRRDVITDNFFLRPQTGIILQDSNADRVSDNEMLNPYYYGVYISGDSEYCSVNDNGIHIWADDNPHVDVCIYTGGTGTHNLISGNNLQTNDNNSKGIYVGAARTLVAGNHVYTISASGSVAIEVDSDYNLIGDNYNFVNTGNELYEVPGHTGNRYDGNWSNDTS